MSQHVPENLPRLSRTRQRLLQWGGAVVGVAGLTVAGFGLFGHSSGEGTPSHGSRTPAVAAQPRQDTDIAQQKTRVANERAAIGHETQVRAQQIASTAGDRILHLLASNNDTISYDNGYAVGVFPSSAETTEMFANTSRNGGNITIGAINMPKGLNADHSNNVQVEFEISRQEARHLNQTAAHRPLTVKDFLRLDLENPAHAQLQEVDIIPNGAGVRQERVMISDPKRGLILETPNTPQAYYPTSVTAPDQLRTFALDVETTLGTLQRAS